MIETEGNAGTKQIRKAIAVAREGQEIPGLPGRKWGSMDLPTISTDGKRLWLLNSQWHHRVWSGAVPPPPANPPESEEYRLACEVLELDREPNSGNLSNVKVILRCDDAILGLQNKGWDLLHTPVPSIGGVYLWATLEKRIRKGPQLQVNRKIIRWSCDRATGKLSLARVIIRD